MDARSLSWIARRLTTRVASEVVVDGHRWKVFGFNADRKTMRHLESLPITTFQCLAAKLVQAGATSKPNSPPPYCLVVIGDSQVGRRRIFLDPEHGQCSLGYLDQERIASALAETLDDEESGALSYSEGCICHLRVTDALTRLVLSDLMRGEGRGHDLDAAARIGLPHARVRQVLRAAEAEGFVVSPTKTH